MNDNLSVCQSNATRTISTAQRGCLDSLSSRLATPNHSTAIKTQGEIEAEISQEMKKFQIEYLGRGPEAVRVFALGNLIVVRLVGVLTPAEKHLVAENGSHRGRNLVKELRTHLIEGARAWMSDMILRVTGVNVVSLHHDISTTTGEEIVVFSLDGIPAMREPKRR